MTPAAAERGAALVLVLLATLLLSALGAALVLSSSTDAAIARNFTLRTQAVAAAEAVLERTVWELAGGGSAFADGPPSGARTLVDGSSLVLDDVVAEAGGDARWTLFAYGTLSALAGDDPHAPPFYVLALLAGGPDPGREQVVVRAEAFGPSGARAIVAATLEPGERGIEVVAWRVE